MCDLHVCVGAGGRARGFMSPIDQQDGITLNILLNILTAIIFDLEINSKSLFGGPGEGQKYF